MRTFHVVTRSLFRRLFHLNKRQTLKRVQGDGHRANGFTLIELLVVVLIIGVLAAIALPQYQTAVDRARYARVMPFTRALKDAAERYYLANGVYPEKLEHVDIEPPGGCVITLNDNTVYCENEWYDLLGGNMGVGPSGWFIVGYTSARYDSDGVASATPHNGFRLWLDQAGKTGVAECICPHGDEREQRLCKSMGTVCGGVLP